MNTFEIIILAIIYIFCYSYLCATLLREKADTSVKLIVALINVILAPLAIVNIAINISNKINK